MWQGGLRQREGRLNAAERGRKVPGGNNLDKGKLFRKCSEPAGKRVDRAPKAAMRTCLCRGFPCSQARRGKDRVAHFSS